MKIIHTSDWHLGQFFYAKSRSDEHQAFFDWLLEQVIRLQIDAIIVAGDIFDTASPPSYARELLNQFIVALQPSGCQLFLLAGNHDSVATLNESRDLVRCLNTKIIAGIDQPQPDVVILKDRHGEPGALLCPIPFLRPRDIQRSHAGLSGREKHQDLLTAISDWYHGYFTRAKHLAQQQQLSRLPIIATGHLTALGVTKSESVRDLYIGSLEAFPISAFPPVDYIALGHIHRAQTLSEHPLCRYSGSPIPLSFDESAHPKSVTLLTTQIDHSLTITPLEIPCFQSLRTIKGNLQTIAQELSELDLPPNGQTLWLDIEVHQQEYLSDLQHRLEALTDGLPVEVLLLRRKREAQHRAITREENETLRELTVNEVFARRLDCESLSDQNRTQLTDLFQQTVDQLATNNQDS